MLEHEGGKGEGKHYGGTATSGPLSDPPSLSSLSQGTVEGHLLFDSKNKDPIPPALGS